jgi:phosphoglycolate phosphatase
MLKHIQAVIIDLDGTMVDTAPDFLVAINSMRSEFDLAPIDLDTIKRFIGKGSENLIHTVLAIDFSEAQIQDHFAAALAAYQRHYLAINGDYSELYPDVIAGLQELRERGLRLACVTNKPIAFTLPLMKKKGIASYFEIIYGGDSFARKKPDPIALLQVCTDFNLATSQVLAIGDSSNDAQAARAAACPVMLVPYGYNHGEAIQNVESDGIVASLLEAARLFSR